MTQDGFTVNVRIVRLADGKFQVTSGGKVSRPMTSAEMTAFLHGVAVVMNAAGPRSAVAPSEVKHGQAEK